MFNKVYVGDTGTEIVLDCGTDISAATDLKVVARKPGGALVEWPAISEDARRIKMVTVSDTLDTAGAWHLWARVTTPLGRWRGESAQLIVRAAWM